jgi:uncharacterized protein
MTSTVLAVIDHWIGRNRGPSVAPIGAPAVAVTGGSSGIGLEIAGLFLSQGETVVLIARDALRLAEAKASFGTAGPRVFTLALDVAAADAPAQIGTFFQDQGLYLDILVNCAGVGLAGAFDSHTAGDIEQLLALNVTALTRLTRYALPEMTARGRGGILNVASLGGYVPGPNQAAYYASKAYVCSLTEALAEEVSGLGVRVTVVAPGPIETRFHAAMGADSALYRWLIPALSAKRAARSAVLGFRLGRTVVVPGLIPKLLVIAVWILPHWLTVPFLKVLLRPPAPSPSQISRVSKKKSRRL